MLPVHTRIKRWCWIVAVSVLFSPLDSHKRSSSKHDTAPTVEGVEFPHASSRPVELPHTPPRHHVDATLCDANSTTLRAPRSARYFLNPPPHFFTLPIHIPFTKCFIPPFSPPLSSHALRVLLRNFILLHTAPPTRDAAVLITNFDASTKFFPPPTKLFTLTPLHALTGLKCWR